MGSLLVVTGPPGAGKSTVARRLAAAADGRSALVEGDRFFGFLARGAIPPWLPGSGDQNATVTRAAAAAAGHFVAGGFTTVFDGVVGPWLLPVFGPGTGLDRLDYVVLLPPAETCVARVASRRDHDFADEAATRKVHAEFAAADVEERHVVRDEAAPADVAALVLAARARGRLHHEVTWSAGRTDPGGSTDDSSTNRSPPAW